MTSSPRVFSKYDNESYKFRFSVELTIERLIGGVPSDPKVAEGWLRSKIQGTDQRIQEMVAQVMVERSVSAEEALKEVNDMKNLNGFKRSESGQLFIEGRQLKAAMKEAVSVAVGAKKIDMTGWGATKKWLTKYFPEHVFVVEESIPLFKWIDNELTPVTDHDRINQTFVHTFRGSSIQYQECVDEAVINFTVISDHEFTTKEWAMLWTTGEQNGVGASRSQGYGKYGVTKWEPIAPK